MEHLSMKEVTTEDFKSSVLESDKPVLVDFWAAWCGPCKALAPILEKIASETEDVTISRLNVDENQALAGQYGVQSIPTMIIFKGGKEAKRLVGLLPAQAIKAELAAFA
jgi:thioredoxin 1